MSVSKETLMKWADDQVWIPTGHKFLLSKFASYADAEGYSWSRIDMLSRHVNKDARTVQRWLGNLKDWGLISDSGRKHRLEESTRCVPLYKLHWEVYALAPDAPVEPSMGDTAVTHTGESMGDTDVTHTDPKTDPWVTKSTGMGDTAVTCIDPIDPSKLASLAAGAREGLDLEFASLEAALPKRMLAVSDPDTAFAVFADLLAEGLSAAFLADCARRMAASDWWKSRRVPVALEDWLKKRQFRGWAPDEVGEGAISTPGAGLAKSGQFPDAKVRASIVGAKGEAFAKSYLDPAAWDEGARVIHPRSSYAVGKLGEIAWLLTRLQVSVGAVRALVDEEVGR